METDMLAAIKESEGKNSMLIKLVRFVIISKLNLNNSA